MTVALGTCDGILGAQLSSGWGPDSKGSQGGRGCRIAIQVVLQDPLNAGARHMVMIHDGYGRLEDAGKNGRNEFQQHTKPHLQGLVTLWICDTEFTGVKAC